jgi:hypothetical protein
MVRPGPMRHHGRVSKDPLLTVEERIATAERLGAACDGHPENVTATLPKVLDMLDDETDPQVLAAIADAFGRMWDPRCLPPLLTLIDHPSDCVRLSVAQALHGAVCNHEVPEGLAALVALSADRDGNVRDWATMALAGCETDSEEIRLPSGLVLMTPLVTPSVKPWLVWHGATILG